MIKKEISAIKALKQVVIELGKLGIDYYSEEKLQNAIIELLDKHSQLERIQIK